MRKNAAAARGKYIATKMAGHRPLTKRAMLRKWPSLVSVHFIDQGIDWIEANTAKSDNPFLFVYENGSAVWGFRSSFPEVALNLAWNLRYLKTRMGTFQKVLDHAISSPVVHMTPKELKAAKSVSAQAGGTVAFIDSMISAI